VITLLGTGHVFNLRARVKDEIRKRQPAVVALELDPNRFQALRNPHMPRRKAPFVYQMLADFQERLAKDAGIRPGDEMLAASEAAEEIGVPVALIDADAQRTFARLRQEMTFGEKMRGIGSILASAFIRSKAVDEQVREMEADYAAYFEALGEKFPTVKRVLLDERNAHMANELVKAAERFPTIVAVVGDGHVDGMSRLLAARGLAVESLRLKDLRGPPPPEPGSSASATVSFDYRE